MWSGAQQDYLTGKDKGYYGKVDPPVLSNCVIAESQTQNTGAASRKIITDYNHVSCLYTHLTSLWAVRCVSRTCHPWDDHNLLTLDFQLHVNKAIIWTGTTPSCLPGLLCQTREFQTLLSSALCVSFCEHKLINCLSSSHIPSYWLL